MFSGRALELLQGSDGQLSSTRFVIIFAFLASTIALFYLHSIEAFQAYLTAWVVNFIGSKYVDSLNIRSQNGTNSTAS